MNRWRDRAALAQNARLYGSFNTPDRRCLCGKLDSEHDDHGDPFTDATKTAEGCVGFVAVKCECKPCKADNCVDGRIPIYDAVRFDRAGIPVEWADSGETRPCKECGGTGKDVSYCGLHAVVDGRLVVVQEDGQPLCFVEGE